MQADQRSLAVAIEAYRVDNSEYPEGTDNPAKYDSRIAAFLGSWGPGFYTLRTRGTSGEVAGADFFTLTTPIAYISTFPTDPFAQQAAGFLTYSYRNAKDRRNGWILTSVGPDADLFSEEGGGPGKGTLNTNPFSTFSDTNSPSRIGDINEREVIRAIENPGNYTTVFETYGSLRGALNDLAYDPTNGTVSDGDIYRLGP